jgi:hypothetical protein
MVVEVETEVADEVDEVVLDLPDPKIVHNQGELHILVDTVMNLWWVLIHLELTFQPDVMSGPGLCVTTVKDKERSAERELVEYLERVCALAQCLN